MGKCYNQTLTIHIQEITYRQAQNCGKFSFETYGYNMTQIIEFPLQTCSVSTSVNSEIIVFLIL